VWGEERKEEMKKRENREGKEKGGKEFSNSPLVFSRIFEFSVGVFLSWKLGIVVWSKQVNLVLDKHP
jgi:hypothetical protein